MSIGPLYPRNRAQTGRSLRRTLVACCLLVLAAAAVASDPNQTTQTGAVPSAPSPVGRLQPSEVPATQIAPFVDINNLASGQWAGAVSAAMEGTRLVYGTMTPEQTRVFESKWAPLFDHPFQEAVDWLNRLNPLLGQFLAIRTTMADTAIQFDGAWKEAVTAAALGDERATREALSIAYAEKQLLAGMKRQLDQVVKAILALGDPPNPRHHRRKQRAGHDSVVTETRQLIRQFGADTPNPTPLRDSGRWVQTTVETREFVGPPTVNRLNGRWVRKKVEWYPIDANNAAAVAAIHEAEKDHVNLELSGTPLGVGARVMLVDAIPSGQTKLQPSWEWAEYKYNADTQSVTIEMSGACKKLLPKVSVGDPDVYQSLPLSCAYRMRWDRPPLTVTRRSPGGWPPINASVECVSETRPSKDELGSNEDNSSSGVLRAGVGGALRNGQVEVIFNSHLDLVMAETGRPERKSNKAIFKWFDGPRLFPNPSDAGSGAGSLISSKPFDPGPYYYAIEASAEMPGMLLRVMKIFKYEWDPTGKVKPSEGGDRDPAPGDPQIRPRTPEESAEEIGFHQDCIQIIQANMAKDQEEINQITDPDRRTALVTRVIAAQANIQAEKDRITTLQTGQIVHTRTAWDELQSAAFIRNCQAEVNEFAARDRFRVGMLRMAGKAAPPQAERLRSFVFKHATPASDSSQLKKITHIVFNQVQGDLEARAAGSEEEAVAADQDLAYVQSVKSTCDKSMFVGALLGGHPVMVAYQGALGFIEGPPPPEPGTPEPPTDPNLGGRVFEGVKRAAAWYNTATFVASEAMEGYDKGGYIGGKENKGAWGAVERSGEAFLMAKAFEYAVGKVLGEPPKAGATTVKEQFELARYRQECEWGKGLVEDYKRTVTEYRRIQEFGATTVEMATLEKLLRQKAASIHSSFEAKLYLKEVHAAGRDATVLEDYVFRIGQNHEATREAWFREMEAGGYDVVRQWKLMEFRNSASAGSPGMDHDMGIWDKGEKFFKDRLRVSTHAMQEDAQKAWEKAYQQTTGYSARQSFENITTGIHAEAYRDLAWIGDESIKHAKVNEILSGWAGQAADVTAFKNYDMFKHLTRLQAIVESSRGMAKDIQTKLLPVLEEGAARFPQSALKIRGGVDAATGRRVFGVIAHWSQIREILRTAPDNPVEADRLLRLLTGKSIHEITADVRDVMAFYGKVIGKAEVIGK